MFYSPLPSPNTAPKVVIIAPTDDCWTCKYCCYDAAATASVAVGGGHKINAFGTRITSSGEPMSFLLIYNSGRPPPLIIYYDAAKKKYTGCAHIHIFSV